MSKSVIRLDHKFTKAVSAKFYVSTTPTAIQNGNVVTLDGLVAGEREIFKAIAPSAITKEIVIVAGVELNADETTRAKANLTEFENEAGRPFRAITPEFGKIFSVSDDAITMLSTATVVGNYVIIKANETKLEEKATLGGTESFVGQVIAKETVCGTVMAVVKIVKCS